jgi:hypothetical protein
MNLKEIAIFAWLPFLAADLGGIFGGYLSPLLMKYFKVKLIPSRIAGIVLGANEFLARCQEHDILCDSFHLSSGYTSIDGKRLMER